jgi:hypothetical protein
MVPYPGTNRPWRCCCLECERDDLTPTLANLRRVPEGQPGCKYCRDRAVDPAKAEALMLDAGRIPQVPYPGSPRAPWLSKCADCGEDSTPSYKAVRRGHGCKFCEKQGFNYLAPAHVYVLFHPELGAVKVGIGGTQVKRDRVKILGRLKWELHTSIWCETGEDAREIEQAVHHHVTNVLGIPGGFVSKDAMPHNGHTETYNEGLISREDLWSLVKAEAELLGYSET